MLLKPINFTTKLIVCKVTTMFAQKLNRHENYFTAAAKEKLRGYGIAPPNRRCGSETEPVSILRFMREAAVASDEVSCPQCGSIDTVESSHFGSTPCKALYKCLACTEPFDYFKPF